MLFFCSLLYFSSRAPGVGCSSKFPSPRCLGKLSAIATVCHVSMSPRKDPVKFGNFEIPHSPTEFEISRPIEPHTPDSKACSRGTISRRVARENFKRPVCFVLVRLLCFVFFLPLVGHCCECMITCIPECFEAPWQSKLGRVEGKTFLLIYYADAAYRALSRSQNEV